MQVCVCRNIYISLCLSDFSFIISFFFFKYYMFCTEASHYCISLEGLLVRV